MVKCADCGFLTKINQETRALEETEQITRNEGIITSPVCFVRANDLWAESGTNYGIICGGSEINIKATLQKDRDCRQFTKWQQGFTPKEHREMLDRTQMLKWQTEREEADRKWQAQQQVRLAVIAGIFVVLGAIIGALVARIH